jgi:fido (protein-threonine AMPylation protein)
MEMSQLTNRQRKILDFLLLENSAGNQQIISNLGEQGEKISRVTLIRDINQLIGLGSIEKFGKGRSAAYKISPSYSLLGQVDPEIFFAKEQDARSTGPIKFNNEIFSKLQYLFSDSEIKNFESKNLDYQKRIIDLPEALVKKEMERITIELAWKSSKIEGNTYSLIDTEILIKENKEAIGHKKDEAIMILNHKKALDYIFLKRDDFKVFSLRKMEDIHALLVDGLNVNKGLRLKPVGITGTNYKPLDNQYQIKESLEITIEEMNKTHDPWSRALIALLMISYIQPFEDGNKRSARLIANACLIAHNVCPLSFRSVDESAYKKAMLIFYELQNASLFKKIFVDQFNFSIDNYFVK